MPYRDRCISSKKKLMIETSYIYDSLDYVLSIMSQCFIPINTTYIKSFMKSQKKLKKLPWVGTREIFFVNFRYQKQGRVFRATILLIRILDSGATKKLIAKSLYFFSEYF